MYTNKKFKKGYFRHVTESKWNLKPFVKPKLKLLFLLNCHPCTQDPHGGRGHARPRLLAAGAPGVGDRPQRDADAGRGEGEAVADVRAPRLRGRDVMWLNLTNDKTI